MTEISFESLFDILGPHPYIILFIGLLFAGETILLPAVFAAIVGRLSMPYVVGLALLATLISDTVWYYIGLRMKDRYFKDIVNARVKRVMDSLARAFEARGGLILFLSKFVYGARIAVQVLSGAHRMPLRRYIAINFLGVFSLIIFIIALAYLADATVSSVDRIAHDVEVAFLAFVAILILMHVFAGRYIKKKWFQR